MTTSGFVFTLMWIGSAVYCVYIGIKNPFSPLVLLTLVGVVMLWAAYEIATDRGTDDIPKPQGGYTPGTPAR